MGHLDRNRTQSAACGALAVPSAASMMHATCIIDKRQRAGTPTCSCGNGEFQMGTHTRWSDDWRRTSPFSFLPWAYRFGDRRTAWESASIHSQDNERSSQARASRGAPFKSRPAQYGKSRCHRCRGPRGGASGRAPIPRAAVVAAGTIVEEAGGRVEQGRQACCKERAALDGSSWVIRLL